MLRLVACVAVAVALAGLLACADGGIIVYTKDTPHTIAAEFRDMPSSFGGDLPEEGLRGLLVPGDPPDGCSVPAKPPSGENFTGKWIVLLARYNCSFEVKVRNAQTAGYDCAIVHNVNSSELETMSAKSPDGIVIPSVFVSDSAGFLLADQYSYNSSYYIMVNGDLPFNINTHLLLPFAVVVALCLLVILVFLIVKCIKDRRRARRHRLPNRCLKKIPTCKFRKGDPYDTCAICLDDYAEGDRLRVLPCAHAYHAKCIDPWLTQNRRVCPVCKRRVLAAGERRRTRTARDSDSDTDDTEPLLASTDRADTADRPTNNTQGGTFVEQSENPFVRATRFMARLRARRHRDGAGGGEEALPPGEANEDTNNGNEENGNEEDTQPLVRPSVRAEAERRPRRARRPPRGARSRSAHAPPTSPAPALRPAEHSINSERGEIGVAALPAPPGPPANHHVDL